MDKRCVVLDPVLNRSIKREKEDPDVLRPCRARCHVEPGVKPLRANAILYVRVCAHVRARAREIVF